MLDLRKRLSALFFPERCVVCGVVTKDGLCPACAEMFRFDTPPFRKQEHCLSVLCYDGVVREAIRRFKFHGKASSAHVFGRWMARRLEEHHPAAFDLVTWMPVSGKRRRERGYDQAYLLAKALCHAREKGEKPMRLLRKRWDNPPQSSLHGRTEREENTRGIYELVHAERVHGANLLLVDDIVTTGTTLSAGMQVLFAAGAVSVMAITLADADVLV